MITRQEALAASSPFLAVVVGEVLLGGFIVIGWNVWDRRKQLIERARAAARM